LIAESNAAYFAWREERLGIGVEFLGILASKINGLADFCLGD